MSAVKEAVLKMIQLLPDDCTYEDIQYHIYVMEKIERGEKAIEQGDVHTQEEVERRMQKWAKSVGLEKPCATSKT